MREIPSSTGNLITVIPFGEPVGVTGDGPEETIQGITARWTYVAYAPHKGYVFSGFLSTSPMPSVSTTSHQKLIIDRIASLSGIRMPLLIVRERRGWPSTQSYNPNNFAVFARKTYGNILVVSIQPDKNGCGWQNGYYDCFSVVGKTDGEYLTSDIASSSIGPVVYIDSQRVIFSQGEAEGDNCDMLGSGNSTVYIFADHKEIHSSWDVSESCPCACDPLGTNGCSCPKKRVRDVSYSLRDHQLKPTTALQSLFAIPE
ncbi:hypothetical protein [Leptospira koniambonensis]|uniref:hypothetical protein n=1 Tax=Leptospira koniambonensis TaxID=2484950 RepID=UPI003EB6DD18